MVISYQLLLVYNSEFARVSILRHIQVMRTVNKIFHNLISNLTVISNE